VLLRGGVELAPQHAGLHPGDAPRRVDVDRLERGEVDHDAALGGPEAGGGVAAGPHRDLEALATRVRERGRDVLDRLAAGDQRRPLVDHLVVDLARDVVAVVVGADQRAGEARDRGSGAGEQERHGSQDRCEPWSLASGESLIRDQGAGQLRH
jgi:hypothetical protein